MSCIFCKIAAGEIPAKVVFENEDLVVFHDLSPQAPVHVLVIPREHLASANEIGAKEAALLGRIWAQFPEIAGRLGVRETGYRIVTNCLEQAGQSVFHLHFHLLGGRPMGWPPG